MSTFHHYLPYVYVFLMAGLGFWHEREYQIKGHVYTLKINYTLVMAIYTFLIIVDVIKSINMLLNYGLNQSTIGWLSLYAIVTFGLVASTIFMTSLGALFVRVRRFTRNRRATRLIAFIPCQLSHFSSISAQKS